MWFIRAGIVSTVLVLLSCGSECKPQSIDTSGITNEDLVGLLIGNAPNPPNAGTGSCQHSCVPFATCCDPPSNPSNGSPNNGKPDIDVRIIELDDRNSPCSGLNLCCERQCRTNTPKPPTKAPIKNQCGMRNAQGVRVTITGFTDSQTQLGEFPWMVAILTQGNEYVGGASLVHPRVVLTAAHKVHNKNPNGLVARIGDWDLADTTELTPPQNINIEKILVHPSFNSGNLNNNVALLILQRNAELGDTVMPICLPSPGQVFDGATCVATGWGKDVFGATGRYQSIMKKAAVPAINHSQCQRMLRTCCSSRLKPDFILHNSFNCAGGNGEDTCEGDGGSPLVCPSATNPDQYVHMGVVSWGIGCGQVGNPGVYGSTSHNIHWINQNIENEVGFVDFDVRIGATG